MPWDVKRALEKDAIFRAALSDCKPAMEDAKDLLVEQINGNFDRESAGERRWRPLAPATLRDRKQKGFPPGPILHRTGNLRNAATEVQEVTSTSAAVGAPDDHPYAKFHAGSGPRSTIPLRDFLAVRAPTIQQIDRAIVAHLEKKE